MTSRFRTCLSLFTILSACTAIPLDPGHDTSDPPEESSGSSGTGAGDESDDDTGDTIGPDDGSSSDDGIRPSGCSAPTAGPTMHPGENVEESEVWTADGSPHLLPYDFTIHAPVLIEACATVQIGGGVTITIGDNGSVVSDGNEQQRVLIERLDDEPWSTIRTLGGEVQLFYTTFD